jgi:hypothetical protein
MKKIFILFLICIACLGFISCKREASSPKELVYFHIRVTGDPFVASVALDQPAESNFFVRFNWFDTDMEPHVQNLNLNAGETYAEDATGIDSTATIRGIEMLDWTKESEHYKYVLDTR